MADNFKTLLFIFAIAGLFMYAMFSFATTFQDANSVTNPLSDDPLVVQITNNLSANVNTLDETAEEQKEAFDTDNPIIGLGELVLSSITTVGKVIGGSMLGFYNIIALVAVVIGIPAIVLNVLTALLLITLILLAWRLYRVGD